LYLPVYLIFDKESRDTWFEGSKTHHYVEASAQWMEQFIPENAAADLRKKADQATDKSAEQMIEGARSRLENLEGLRPEEEAAPVEETPAGEGYEREERRDMNELIMDSVNE
ncbi:MAG: hypothetical protein KKA05_04115, partial [Alphaproteobacteria bacterium]|nr:hypothetical protein [Alphaproteobacteria bacterium]